MIEAIILDVIQQFSLRTLYLEMGWFATFGYLIHVFVIMGFTRLPFFTLLQSIFRLQISAILVSFLLAPMLATVSKLFSSLLPSYTIWFMGQQVYVWFTVIMMFVASYFLCQIFVTIACKRLRIALIVANILVGILGLFVLKALNLLMLM